MLSRLMRTRDARRPLADRGFSFATPSSTSWLAQSAMPRANSFPLRSTTLTTSIGENGLSIRTTPETSKLAFPCVIARCRSEEHTSELQSRRDLVCRLLLEKKKKKTKQKYINIIGNKHKTVGN